MSETDDSGTDDYRATIRRDREQKDEFFGEHPRSPLPAAARGEFDGLRYFDVDPTLRFELTLHEFDDPEQITVETTQDGEQVYHDIGEFRFSVEGTEVTLHAFQPPDDENRLWVPFRDETSGETTYPSGRYLDLEDPDHRTADGRWILDFNTAYNPFCAYADAYECPLVPMDNWLDVPIHAGEKGPELDGH